MKPNKIHLECACSSLEHQIVIIKFKDEPLFFIEIHLAKKRLLTRIKYAIKYIFGYKCAFGAFQEFLLEDEGKQELIDFLNNN